MNSNITIMYSGQASPYVGWLAVDELAELLAYYADAILVSPKPIKQSRIADKILGGSRFEPIISIGGDILIVVARAASDLNMVKSISDYRRKFSKIFGVVTDSYHQPSYLDITAEFDEIFVTAADDEKFVRNKFKIKVSQMYQGIDTLRWGPTVSTQRNIDIVGFGRMPPTYHEKFMQNFHQPDSPYLYLHSPLGNITGPTIGLERGMLFKILQRSKISLAFNLHVGATGNRPISMMVTSRWLESLLSGCIVAGKRPVSRMADDMLYWENSTIELSDNAEAAVDELKSILIDDDDCNFQRANNISHVMRKHDWRFRLQDLSEKCGINFNKYLDEDIQLVNNRSKEWCQFF